jgi:hypothetical protein
MGSIKDEVHTDVLVDVRLMAGKKEKIGNEGNKGKEIDAPIAKSEGFLVQQVHLN